MSQTIQKHIVEFLNGYVVFTATEVHLSIQSALLLATKCTIIEEVIYARCLPSSDVTKNTIFKDIKGTETTFFNVTHYRTLLEKDYIRQR